MASGSDERLAAAQSAVDQVCQLLTTPALPQMDACTPLLENAAAELSAFHKTIGANSTSGGARNLDALAEARLLSQSIGRAARLLESAAAFHVNWIRFLGAFCAGYTGAGQPAAVERGRRLLARG